MSLEEQMQRLTTAVERLNQNLEAGATGVTNNAAGASKPEAGDSEPEKPVKSQSGESQSKKKGGRPKNLSTPRYFSHDGEGYKAKTDKDLERLEGCSEVSAARYDELTGENESGLVNTGSDDDGDDTDGTRYWHRTSTGARMKTGPETSKDKIKKLEKDAEVSEISAERFYEIEAKEQAEADDRTPDDDAADASEGTSEPEDDGEEESEDDGEDDGLGMDEPEQEEEPEVTDEMLKAKMIELKDFGGKAAHKDDVAKIMHEHGNGASNFQGIPESHYAACYKAAQATLDQLEG